MEVTHGDVAGNGGNDDNVLKDDGAVVVVLFKSLDAVVVIFELVDLVVVVALLTGEMDGATVRVGCNTIPEVLMDEPSLGVV